MIRCLFTCMLLGSVVLETLTAQPRGGSSYVYYQVDPSPWPACDGEAYGIIHNYDTAQATIGAHLSQMASAGQRTLRLMFFHWRGGGAGGNGTIMDSTDPASAGSPMQTRFLPNLTNLLAAAQARGFGGVVISMVHGTGAAPGTKAITRRTGH